MTEQELIDFEREVELAFMNKEIRGPIHLSGGNERQLIDIFQEVKREDWVLSTWRSHYHALLHGVPRQKVMTEILAGRSMMLHFPEHRFMTSSIVGGMLPIACGLAAGGNKVWCFIGDMCASIGVFEDAVKFANGYGLNVHFVIEDNGVATNTPTRAAWGLHAHGEGRVHPYSYERTQPHCGAGRYVAF